jgi:hypothetical protein
VVLDADEEGEVRPAAEPQRRAEAPAAEGERDDEQQDAERRAGGEEPRGRAGARKRVGEDASVRGQRSGGGRYAGRARCLNAFTSSSGAASGTSSRQVTTGTPTCS